MALYALRRLLNAIPILIGITILSFAIIHMAPGSPLSPYLDDPTIKAVDKENMIKAYGLDKPLYVQYWDWVSGIARGDLGTSFQKNEPVTNLILDRLPATLLLTVSSFAVSLLIAIPLGILCALRANSRLDQLVTAFSNVGISIPGFWLGLVLMMFFAVKLGWLPSGGRGQVGTVFGIPTSLATRDGWAHVILPALNLSLFNMGLMIRLTRAGVVEAMRMDYVKFARAQGLPDGQIVRRHVLRNIMIPVITVFGLELGSTMAFAVVTETVFNWPGVGKLIIDSILQLDRPVMVAYLVLVVTLFVLINLVVDLIYAQLDPRIRLKGGA